MNLTEQANASTEHGSSAGELQGVEPLQTHTVAEEGSHTAQDAGLLASLGINGKLFAFQLVNFVIVALVVWYLILKPLVSKMTERQGIIDKSLKDAEELEKNIKKSEQKFQEKVDEAKVEASKIIEEAHEQAKESAEQTKEKSKEEIELLVVQAKKNIKMEREEMMREIKGEVANMVVMAVEKVLNEKMDSAKDKELIRKSLESIKK